ncbi:hypothetical protein [Pseudorhizobium marinum]|uniref:hypothetical protein n=1 Tax=Pseudorhizobium marinum TaxID=1496690 RepID=UPI0004958B44|nr:hypothetical protein [Pseudorhizobium marinum]
MTGASDFIWELVRTALALDGVSERKLTALLTRAIGFIQDIHPFDASTADATRSELITLLTSPQTVASLPRDLIQIYLLNAADIIAEWTKNNGSTNVDRWHSSAPTVH